MPNKQQMESLEKKLTIQELVSKGKSREYCVNWLKEQGMTTKNAQRLYYSTLKELVPDVDMLDDYKKGMVQTNINRLEKIIDKNIDGDFKANGVAIKAISELNKMMGISDGNSVTIAQKDGEQIIKIDFSH